MKGLSQKFLAFLGNLQFVQFVIVAVTDNVFIYIPNEHNYTFMMSGANEENYKHLVSRARKKNWTL